MKYILTSILLFLTHTIFAACPTFDSNGLCTIDADSTTDVAQTIKTAFSAAHDGNTIHLQPGTHSMKSRLVLTGGAKNVTIEGVGPAGTNVTTVLLDFSGAGTSIDWTIPDGPALPAAYQVSTLRGIYFKLGQRASGGIQFRFAGSNNLANSRFHWTNCRVEFSGEMNLEEWIGLIDHCDFINKAGTGGTSCFKPGHSKWNGGTYGHKSWGDPINWNSDEFIYVEDCSFYGDGGTGYQYPDGTVVMGSTMPAISSRTNGSLPDAHGVTDATSSSRIIVRHCKTFNMTMLTHGNDTGNTVPLPGVFRGVVAVGRFSNDFYNMTTVMTDLRSGVEMNHGNRLHNTTGGLQGTIGGFKHQIYRNYDYTWVYHSGIDGKTGGEVGGTTYDQNDTTGGPTGDGIYFKGQATVNSAPIAGGFNSYRVTVTPVSPYSPMTPNQFQPVEPGPPYFNTRGFVVVNTSISNIADAANTHATWFGSILANGTNTIDYFSLPFKATLHGITSFSAGQNVEVRRVIVAMDGTGVHGNKNDKGVDPWLTGNPNPTNLSLNVNGLNGQVTVPCYYWDNLATNDKTTGLVTTPIKAGSYGGLGNSRENIHFINLSGSATPPPTAFTEYQGATGRHPLNPDSVTTPIIVGGSSGGTSFTSGTAADCGTAKINCYQFATQNFSGTPTWSVVGGMPSSLSWASLGSTNGQLSGNPPSNAATPVTITVRASQTTPSAQSADQLFAISVLQANHAPTWPAGSFTVTPASGIPPLTVNLTANPDDVDNNLQRVEFYRGGTQIANVTNSPYTATDAGLLIGVYSYTAIAYDTIGAHTTTPVPLAVTVSAAPPTPTPATIIVNP